MPSVTYPHTRATTSMQYYSLLQLPAELRNDIYGLVLTSYGEIKMPATGALARPPLLQVCQQITREATQLYYASSTFYLQFIPADLSPVRLWLRSIGRKHADAIQMLAIALDIEQELILGGCGQPIEYNVQKKWNATAAALLESGIRPGSIVVRAPSFREEPERRYGCMRVVRRVPEWMFDSVMEMTAAIERASTASHP